MAERLLLEVHDIKVQDTQIAPAFRRQIRKYRAFIHWRCRIAKNAKQKEGEWILYQTAQLKAVRDFLKRGGYTNMAEGGQDLGLQPQELWNKIMREADLPLSEMPETMRVR